MILRWTSQRSSRNASCAPSPQRDAPSSSSQRLAGIAIALAVLLAPGAAAAPPQQLGHQYQQIAFVAPAPAPAPAEAGPSSFSLVHAVHFGTHSHPGLRVQHRFDPADEASYASLALPSSSSSSAFGAQLSGEDASFEDSKAALYPAIETFPIRTVRQTIWKPSHPARSEVYEAARRVSMPQFAGDQSLRAIGEQLSWEQVEVASPDVADVTTLSTLAKMSSNAYSTSQDEGWYDLSSNDTSRPSYNLSSSFGWEEDGIRGHVFSSGPANETIVIALKGTSAFVGGGRTGRNDKLNDNLLFSCCCARIDWTWSPVCDCYNGTSSKSGDQRCNLTCLEDALIEKSVYYPTATDLFNNITDMYPRSQIWLTGHSLGGSLAALLGVTFGIPTVTFEAPGDLLPAKRLHLPLPPGSDWSDPDSRPDFGITHVYTNSDPIPQGVCTGTLSTCNLVGFALESKCHTGQSIVYDAVGKLGWSVDIRTHRIGVVIDKLLVANWDGESEEEAGVNAVRKADQQKAATPTLVAERKSWLWPWPGRRRRNESDSPADPTSSTTSSQLPDPTQPTKDRKKSHVPPPKTDHKCIDCFKWEFFDDYEGHRPGQNTSFLGALSRTLP